MLDRAPRFVGNIYTLLVVLVAWVFFRCDDITSAWRYTHALWTPGHGDPSLVYPAYYLANDVLFALAIGVVGGLGLHDVLLRWMKTRLEGSRLHAQLAWSSDVALLCLFVLTSMAVATRTFDPFIYFRF
jgi:alginate O-acetyltransferase complex protein AlgI